MMDVEIARAVGTVLLGVTLLAAVAFPVMYSRSNWRATMVGRDTMLMSVTFVVILGQALAAYVFGFDDPTRLVIRIVVFGVLAFVFTRRLWVLYRVQYPKKEQKSEPPNSLRD